MKKLCLALLSVLAFSHLSGQGNGYFTNPVIKGDMADPTVIRIDKTYYTAGTSSEWAPYYPVYSSRDLVNWTMEGHIFKEKPEWTSNSFWAPELFYHNGKVFCYYTARRKTDGVSYVGVASADSPTGKYTDHGVLIEWGTEAIDAYVFDDEGQLYISWKAYGLDPRHIEMMASKLSPDGLRLEGEPFSLMVDDEDIGMEGQYHFRHGDWYYIIYAAHGCCGPGSDYDVYVARSRSFEGPYEKFAGNPILHGGQGDFQSCGHGTGVVTPDGRYFFLCHAYMPGDWFFMGRQPILQEFFITDDGWVQFKTGSVAIARQEVPFRGTKQKPAAGFEDNFKGKTLKPEWSWNYPYSDIDVKVGKGLLTLSGTPKDDNKYGTALCLRAETPEYEYRTQVYAANKSLKGLTFYGDKTNLALFGIENGKIQIKVVRNGTETVIYDERGASISPHLKIVVQGGCRLDFYESTDGKSWIKLNTESINAMDYIPWDRVARPGLIHIGPHNVPADFSYFKMTNL